MHKTEWALTSPAPRTLDAQGHGFTKRAPIVYTL